MDLIQAVAQNRGIEFLAHFTRLENIPSIMTRGLIPRLRLEADGIQVSFNDAYRIDGCTDASCLSINFPNYKMFWACRQEYKDVKWVVLAISPRILWEKDCAFCQENAASNAVTCIPLVSRKGVDAFNRLYEEIAGKPTRKESGISDGVPTNPQAEVLVFDVIKADLILGVLVQDQVTLTEMIKLCPEVKAQVMQGMFSPRKDFQHWK